MYSIGVDLGGTKIGAGLVDSQGNLVHSIEVATEAHRGAQSVIECIANSISQVLEKADKSKLVGIGIGSPGPLNPKTGLILSPPNLPGFDRIPLRDIIAARFGLPTYLENDANAAAIAEREFGAGGRADNMVYVTVSTGIGAGVYLDGKLRQGEIGCAAEVGHMIVQIDGPLCPCGNRGCLEAVASGTAISRIASERFGKPMNARDVVAMAENGDRDAQSILHGVFHALGVGIINLVNVYDPSVIVVGGGVAQIGEPLFAVLRESVARNGLRDTAAQVRIVPAKLGTKAGVIGAGALPFLHNQS